jgi:hypothetical protein
VAEWYTRRSQKPLAARPCGFDSHLRYILAIWVRFSYSEPVADQETRQHYFNLEDNQFINRGEFYSLDQRGHSRWSLGSNLRRFGIIATGSISGMTAGMYGGISGVALAHGVSPDTLLSVTVPSSNDEMIVGAMMVGLVCGFAGMMGGAEITARLVQRSNHSRPSLPNPTSL